MRINLIFSNHKPYLSFLGSPHEHYINLFCISYILYTPCTSPSLTSKVMLTTWLFIYYSIHFFYHNNWKYNCACFSTFATVVGVNVRPKQCVQGCLCICSTLLCPCVLKHNCLLTCTFCFSFSLFSPSAEWVIYCVHAPCGGYGPPFRHGVTSAVSFLLAVTSLTGRA